MKNLVPSRRRGSPWLVFAVLLGCCLSVCFFVSLFSSPVYAIRSNSKPTDSTVESSVAFANEEPEDKDSDRDVPIKPHAFGGEEGSAADSLAVVSAAAAAAFAAESATEAGESAAESKEEEAAAAAPPAAAAAAAGGAAAGKLSSSKSEGAPVLPEASQSEREEVLLKPEIKTEKKTETAVVAAA
ncbi:hypothetical protein, conserved [Eimeria praecox]|uniref:Uncharacterized protein n=1 Tax=Eimeria praecox TaxID=51316 RepID=U6GPT5_9EIME|nr:hypothetical protein, conserved [Eimeria praecox]